MKTIRPIVLMMLFALAASSCVYDFNPQIDGEGGYLVVDGDIVLGTVCDITCRWSWSLVDTTQQENQRELFYTNRMHIEDNRGKRYENLFYTSWDPLSSSSATGGGPSGRFDLTEADPSLEYRLVVENSKGTYASAWAAALPPAEIDSLSYQISADRKTMDIQISTHSDNAPGSYYRWQVEEVWEYTADVYTPNMAIFSYLPDGRRTIEVVPFPPDRNIYYCWSWNRRQELMVGSTTGLSGDRLVNHTLYTLANTDARTSRLYRIDVRQTRISEDAYHYYEMMDRNARDVGGLFSPEPSEYRGNLVNLSDPDELVLGYVDVTAVSSARYYINSWTVRFYRNPSPPIPEPEVLGTLAEWLDAYYRGLLPGGEVYNEETGLFLGYEWWPARCLDCQVKGGSKSRPADWPNNDY